MDFNDFHWLLFDVQWFSLICIWFSLIFIDFHWIFIDVHWFSLIFKENGASVGQPSTAFGPLGVGVKRCKSGVSREASSKNRTRVPTRSAPIGSLRRPSAAFGGHRQPSAPAGWELSVGTGLPPQTPPDFLFVIYKVYCCRCCLLLSHAGGVGG